MKWITREQIRIDRVSSAWLIKKFVVSPHILEFSHFAIPLHSIFRWNGGCNLA